MAQYTWDNRIKFLVGYLYDLDNNGHMNKNDFDCLAVKFTVMEGRGEWNEKRFGLVCHQLNKKVGEIKKFLFLVSPATP